jgi:hypothetical protein
MNNFFDVSFQNDLRYVVDHEFPKLNFLDKQQLTIVLFQFINKIADHFTFDKKNMAIYKSQFQYKNYQDVRSLIRLLLPYFENGNQITKLSELSTNYDLNQNYLLILETIEIISHKLFVNFINVQPITLHNYKDRSVYKETFNYFYKNVDSLKRLSFYDIYNTISIELYEKIVPYKWIIYDYVHENKPYPYLIVLNTFIDFSLYTDIVWSELSESLKQSFKQKLNHPIVQKILRKKNPEDAYNYLFQTVDRIKQTWYYHKMCSNQQLKTISNYQIEYIDQLPVSIKNIYNFAKSFCHFKELNRLPIYWQSVSEVDKKIVQERVFKDDWFNNKNYVRKIIQDSAQIDRYHQLLFGSIRNNIVDILFESLIFRGVLSEFVPDTTYFKLNEKQNPVQMVSYMKQKLNANRHQYHFLCEKQLQYLRTKDNSDYLNSLASEKWYSLYAFNWVSQIQVFHKYIHNRVIYVTGSTGVGKSTQIPKLFMYSLKMISYKQSGKVVCSEPRYDPTIKNATKIADEFGVSLSKNNYYIQIDLKDKSKQHKKLTNHLELKFITDGKLFQEIIKSPVLKTIKNNQFTSQNQYDVIIIDESHEHNRYIDLLLTLLRHSIYFNNDTILVIMSATMENDEPIYRKYYRNINDNLKYPIFKLLKEKQFDRIHIDRRIHISPPGETTLNQITEYYMPNETIQSILKHILKTSQSGDILIFVPKVKELLDLVTEINATIQDSRILAIPFHAKLKNREIITYLDDYRNQIHISKDDNFEDLTMETIKQSSKSTQSKYTRYIIVATSIAEASITLTHLKYVIDTGKHQTVSYDYKRMIDIQEVKPISNDSRIQRKGRVGRVSSGTVYYLYSKEYTHLEKPRYEIENDDITENIYSLCKFTDDNEPLFTSNNDPNLNDIVNISSYKYNLNEMILLQYFTYNKFDVFRGKLGTHVPPPYSYMSGYLSETLFDQNGSFYMIHPEESALKQSDNGIKMNKVFHQLQLWGFTTKKNEKTLFGKYCLDLLYDENIDTTLNLTDLIVFVCGYILKCLHELILLRYALEFNVEMTFTDSNSDLISLYRLISSGRLDSEQMQSIEKKRKSMEYIADKIKTVMTNIELPLIFQNLQRYRYKSLEERLVYCFATGYYKQIVLKLDNEMYGVRLCSPSPYDIYKLSRHLTKVYPYKYVLYLNIKEDPKRVRILSNVSEEFINEFLIKMRHLFHIEDNYNVSTILHKLTDDNKKKIYHILHKYYRTLQYIKNRFYHK